jgi:hypothetical protein
MKKSLILTIAVVLVAGLVGYAWACGVGTAPHSDESHHIAGAPHGDESHHDTAEPVQMIEEAKAQEAAEAFVTKYLSGYTIDKIEKDDAHAAYLVTVKGGSGAELQVVVNGVNGQVTYIVVPTPAE